MKYLILMLCVGLSFSVNSWAAETLDQLLNEVKQERTYNQATMQKRLSAFQADVSQQQKRLREAKAVLAAQQKKSDELKARFDANEVALTQLQETLDIRLGDMGELFGVVRQVAADGLSRINNSLVSAELTNRTELLETLAAAKMLPSIDDLEGLQAILLEEMIETGKVTRFQREVVNQEGQIGQAEMVRVGAHNLIAKDKFLTFDPDTQVVQALARQPQQRYRDQAQHVFSAQTGIHGMAIDPVMGQYLAKLIQKPTWTEKVKQGGAVGSIIILLGLFGLLLVVWRGGVLFLTGKRMRKQLRTDAANKNNPLGRVLAVHDVHQTTDVETLELKLDEAILKETPKLERGQVWLKLIAAVAPLLGLLGTVVGMIDVFQDITLFGTGDPKLMAGGISKALVTTMLGLAVAIPVVILHSFIAGKSRHLIEVLEEQSAGIIARQAEKQA